MGGISTFEEGRNGVRGEKEKRVSGGKQGKGETIYGGKE